MSKQKTVRLLGRVYKIDRSLHSNQLGGAAGHCNPPLSCIRIAWDLTDPQMLISVFLHELVEAINYHQDLQLPHHKLELLETGFNSFIRDNDIDISKFFNKPKRKR